MVGTLVDHHFIVRDIREDVLSPVRIAIHHSEMGLGNRLYQTQE
jgi:hypothetical protein